MHYRLKFLIVVLTIFFNASCLTTTTTNQSAKTETDFDTLPFPRDSSVLYFKLKKNWKDSVPDALDAFVDKWYSEMLFALNEPVLSNYQGDKEIYRFTWLRTFHHPIAIRIEKQNELIKLFTKVCNGAGGYHPGKLVSNYSFDIKPDQFGFLTKKIEAINFWHLPTEVQKGGMDGAEWIIEVVRNNKYHVVTRWSPTIEQGQKDFGDVGKYFLSISKIRKEETRHIY